MLRKILIGLGLLVTILPYLGFPAAVDTVVSTAAGLMIIFLLTFGRKVRPHHEVSENVTEAPHRLHVERLEVDDAPQMHIEKQITVDTEEIEESPDTETTIEKKTTVTRKRRRAVDANTSFIPPGE
ncbi:MAG: hypothetical protein A2494_03655 [Candidatus Lloydbacteria bacterium RIFOXYC12_FULL_46_25]|uniref:Uncharacterized protein n=1 Tax=Candidatus Lloydbacteria bacterium RIFOXYC12_FULL_46_25 TaxID=1798670 RepID=A0A1G2E264_9BACT|nr:MAG: hypothetical protein A2494_03655 [Candidatus Lloydbacteria bacterium RIFOXYC12_FULL_46_25]